MGAHKGASHTILRPVDTEHQGFVGEAAAAGLANWSPGEGELWRAFKELWLHPYAEPLRLRDLRPKVFLCQLGP